MPPADRFVPRFFAEPPQEGLPYGRWADRLGEEFLAACAAAIDGDAEIGRPREVAWHPDRSWNGLTYVPASALSDREYELFGYVCFAAATQPGAEPERFQALADFTQETAEHNPSWKLDLCDEVIGSWRGHSAERASITLVWGRALLPGGRIATAELGGVVVDQCELEQERFTLIAPDDYRGDLLEVALFDARGRELARESLYADDDQDDDPGADDEPDDDPQGDDHSTHDEQGDDPQGDDHSTHDEQDDDPDADDEQDDDPRASSDSQKAVDAEQS